MKKIALQDCLENGKYVYNIRLTPVENYQFFLQSIAFSRGVEFMASDNLEKKSFLYLYDLPGLTIDLKKAKQELKSFYENLINHIDAIIINERDAFIKYASVYDLFKEVQDDLKYPAPVSFLAIERIYHNPNKLATIKQKNINLIKGFRKSPFVELANDGFLQLSYEQLGFEIKKFIRDIFKFQNRFKKELFKQLKNRIEILFERKKHLKHYQYMGDQADIAEVAIVLFDNITIFGKSNLTLQQFTDDIANYFKVKTFRLSDLKDILNRRKTNNELFFNKGRKKVAEYISGLNKYL